MKANKAPEKIYLYSSDIPDQEYEAEWGCQSWDENSVEYTRTDAFIEKEFTRLYNEVKPEYVYVVTRSEEHADYVEKCFLDENKAQAYCKPFNEDENCYSRDITKIKIEQ